MNLLSRLFKRKQPQWSPKRIINVWEHNSWGNAISWHDYERRELGGHMTPKPEVDDEIRAKFESGKTGRFRVISVRDVASVHDMFWCTVKDIGYLKTNTENYDT